MESVCFGLSLTLTTRLQVEQQQQVLPFKKARLAVSVRSDSLFYFEVVTYPSIETLYLSVIGPSTQWASYSLFAITSAQIWWLSM